MKTRVSADAGAVKMNAQARSAGMNRMMHRKMRGALSIDNPK
jgi:hypothetical protein